jgi:hypothetical protein
LHIDIDASQATRYNGILANLFKKNSSKKPLGLSHLRIIPCFTSEEGKYMTPESCESAEKMRNKQTYALNSHTAVLRTNFIQNLDKPVSKKNPMTLRRYLKSMTPEGSVTLRLILSIDKSWQDRSNETIIVTTKPWAAQTREVLKNMIPACIHMYQKGVEGWFTPEGLKAFEGIHWDPNKKYTVSARDIEAQREVEEDFFGMGDDWKNIELPGETKRPVMKKTSNTKTTPENNNITATTLLEGVTNKSTDAASFGAVYNRPHDGDTAKTSRHQEADEASLSSHESVEIVDAVTIDNITNVTTKLKGKSIAGDQSTAKSSGYHKAQLVKVKQIAAAHEEESKKLYKELKEERKRREQEKEELEQARRQIAQLLSGKKDQAKPLEVEIHVADSMDTDNDICDSDSNKLSNAEEENVEDGSIVLEDEIVLEDDESEKETDGMARTNSDQSEDEDEASSEDSITTDNLRVIVNRNSQVKFNKSTYNTRQSSSSKFKGQTTRNTVTPSTINKGNNTATRVDSGGRDP